MSIFEEYGAFKETKTRTKDVPTYLFACASDPLGQTCNFRRPFKQEIRFSSSHLRKGMSLKFVIIMYGSWILFFFT